MGNSWLNMAGFSFRARLRDLFGRTSLPGPGPSLPAKSARPRGPESFAEDNNDFTLAMYGQLRRRPGNRGVPSIEYSVYLRTPAEHYAEDRKKFEQLLTTFHFLPPNGK